MAREGGSSVGSSAERRAAARRSVLTPLSSQSAYSRVVDWYDRPMKKVFRFFGVLAGLGTVIWVMRDRFISLALPREPEPPTFRVAPHPPSEDEPSPKDDLTIIKGVGPVYAARLEDAGVTGLAGLSAADGETLAKLIDVSTDRVNGWIEEATFLSSFRGN